MRWSSRPVDGQPVASSPTPNRYTTMLCGRELERAWVPTQGGQHLTKTKTKTGKGRTVFVGAEGLRILEQ